MALIIVIPDDVEHALKLPRKSTTEELKRLVAVKLYEKGILGIGKSREFAELSLLEFYALLMGQEVYYANQVTVGWDPVSDSGAISYEVYVSPYPVVNPLDPGAHILVVETTATEAVVTFQAEGKYAVGVRTKKSIEGEELFSEINWSYENGAMTPNPFIVGYYIGPAAPVNLRLR